MCASYDLGMFSTRPLSLLFCTSPDVRTYPLFPLLPLRLLSFSLRILTLLAVILPPRSLVRVLGRLQTSFCVRDNGLDRPSCSRLALLLFSPTARPVPAFLQLRTRQSFATTSIRRCASESCMPSRCSRPAAPPRPLQTPYHPRELLRRRWRRA
jgi:hypothetical protein